MSEQTPEPVAIIGIGCRLPGGADDPEAFWRLLLAGTNTVRDIPADRWDVDSYYHPDPGRPGKMYSRRGSFLDGVDRFDADFFHISPREAACMDPQQRLLLELAWEALEDGGQAPGRLAGTEVAVYMGICTTDYSAVRRADPTTIDSYTGTGSASSIAANRISYTFDFRGPSLAVDTACSSSLVAVHLACRSLQTGEARVALAGGVNLMFDPTINISFCRANMLSPRGQCSSFDESADGFVRAEGAGVVVLKPLADAVAAGDPVYAVIRGTAVNQDGRTVGISFPNGDAQAELIRMACATAGVDPGQVQYVEAHGTGTAAGDPVECGALGTVLGAGRPPGEALRIGSVKSNIGHPEAASGIVGLIKATLALKHRHLPASIHFRRPNPAIPFADLGLRVQHRSEPWPDTDGPAIAGVNSFGFGGTSAHAVLEEYWSAAPQEPAPAHPAVPTRLLPISARDPQALRDYAAAYLPLVDGPTPLADLCRTAGTHRDHHPYRMAVTGGSRAEIREALEACAAGEEHPALTVSDRPAAEAVRVVFGYSGNGAQWAGMGRQLLAEEPVFADAVAAVDVRLRERTGWSVRDELIHDEARSRMARTDVAQPCLFAVQVGLTALWRSWGVQPAAVAGHSVGEVAAAYTAGILTLDQAVDVIVHRSRVQQRTEGSGAMAAVGLSEDAAREAIAPYGDRLTVAAVNAPKSVTVSGDEAPLRELVATLTDAQVFCRVLALDYAFHSPHMDLVRDDLLDSLADLKPGVAELPFVSTVTGEPVQGTELDAAYWWDNVRRPVRFAAAVTALTGPEPTAFVEIGPHPVLGHYVRDCLADAGAAGTVLASVRRQAPESATLRGALAGLYTYGYLPDWERLVPDGRPTAALPRYPWQRQRHWQEITGGRGRQLPGSRVHPLLGLRVDAAQPTFESTMDAAPLDYLMDHRVQHEPVLPAAGFVELALAAARAADPDTAGVVLDDVDIRQPLLLGGADPVTVQVTRSIEDGATRISSRTGTEWIVNATADARPWTPPADPVRIDLADIQARCPREYQADTLYPAAERHGLQYGPRFQVVTRAFAGTDEVLGEVRLPEDTDTDGYLLHPAALDGSFQAMLAYVLAPDDGDELPAFLPVGLDRLRLHRPAGRSLYCHIRIVHCGSGSMRADLSIVDPEGLLVAEISGFRLRAFGRSATHTVDDPVFEEGWTPAARPGRRRRQAGHLPAPAELADRSALPAELTDLIVQLDRERHYREIAPAVDALAADYIRAALTGLGWDPRPGDRVIADDLCDRLGIEDQHRRLLGYFLRVLAEDGHLETDGAGWTVRRPLGDADPTPVWADLATRLPAYHSELLLLARCGTRLAEVLTGRIDPLEILFGERTSATLDHFYDSGVMARVYNAMMRMVVARIVEALPAERTLRVLEIGAGTGGTTSHLLPILPPERTEYVFTDVSERFLRLAAARYATHPFVRYRVLDIEKDPVEQGFDEHTFDLVVASNVVHATRDLRWTLGNVRRLMASEGLLAFAEITDPPRMVFTIFGLLRGFWLFLDDDVRPDVALLPPRRWLDLLGEEGFVDPQVLTERDGRAEQSILLARGPALADGETVAAEGDSKRGWLIFADEGGVARRLARDLTADGDRVAFVHKGQDGTADLDRLVAEWGSDDHPLTDVVHLWALDAPEPDDAALSDAQRELYLPVVRLVQYLTAAEGAGSPRLTLVTGGAQPLRPGVDPVAVVQSPLVGLRRVVFSEHPELRCAHVDLSPPRPEGDRYADGEIAALADELRARDQEAAEGWEDEILLRGPERFAGRLRRRAVPADSDTDGDTVRRLAIGTPGMLDTLTLRAVPRQQPGPGEVEIEVAAAGMNFKDVMHAMGLLPIESVESGFAGRLCLGGECAGRISAVGPGVTQWSVGDPVVALGRDAFASHMVTDADLAVPVPAGVSHEEAATLLLAYVTCHYSLRHLARLQPGERVLIHHGTGGVGLAAIQVAHALGAEVVATAGSPEKREYLRLLGVRHVLDSRSFTFADEVLRRTGGVDVVLNSTTGAGLSESLRVLKRFGRFVELGKQDILGNRRLGMRPFERCLSMFAVDVDQLLLAGRDVIRVVLREVIDLVGQGVYRPLVHRTFPADRAGAAFRHMQQARHIGKVVVAMGGTAAATVPTAHTPPPPIRGDGTYLVSGGLGGFGLATARWLARRGAGHLVLAGRSGAATVQAQQAVEALRADGVEVTVAKVDIGDSAQVRELCDTIRAGTRPLRGVVHAAMVLDDVLLRDLDAERLDRVLGPKLRGAWNLHRHTLSDPVEVFVMFSSMTSVFGNAGQGNYVTGNAFLDHFAAYRRHAGRPGLTVNWGGIADVGYVAAQAERGERLLRRGVAAMDPDVALDLMARLLRHDRVRATVAEIDWHRARTVWPVTSPRWADLLPEDGVDPGTGVAGGPAQQILAAPPDERQAMVTAWLTDRLSCVLGSSLADADLERSMTDAGLDSLMAMELRIRVEKELGVDVAVMQLMQAKTLGDLATILLEQMLAKAVPAGE